LTGTPPPVPAAAPPPDDEPPAPTGPSLVRTVGHTPTGKPKPNYRKDDPTRSPRIPFAGGKPQKGNAALDGVSDYVAVLTVFDDPATYDTAAALPPPADGTPGPRPMHPDWMMVGWAKCIDPLRTSRRVHFALDDDSPLFRDVLGLARRHVGDAAVDAYQATAVGPPRLHHFNTWLRRVKDLDADDSNPMFDAVRAANRRIARETGALDPDHPRGLTNLTRANVVGADGTVAASPTRNTDPEWVDEKTGQVHTRRLDDAAYWHYENGGDKPKRVHGVKLARISVRANSDWHLTTILDTEHVHPGDGGEMAVIMRMFTRLAEAEPGTRGLVTDMVMRGVHADELLRQGTQPVSKIRTGTWRPEYPGDTRPDKPTPHMALFPPLAGGIATHTHEHGQCKHTVGAENGWAIEVVVGADGKRHHKRLAHKHLERRRPNGDTDHYARLFIPCPFGTERRHDAEGELTRGHDHQVNARQCKDYDDAGFNVGEYFRLVRAGDPQFERIVPGRNNTEQLHSRRDENYYRRRIPAWGRKRQRIISVLMDAGHNSLTRWIAAGKPSLYDKTVLKAA